MTPNQRSARRSFVLLAAILILGSSCAPSAAPTRAVDTPGKPNIVLIVTDDQRWDTLWAMPTVQTELVEHGIVFAKAFASNPLCCPSRATILTGLYSHSTGVYTNKGGPRYAGFAAFDDRSTVATWLDEEGYRTGLFGKYFNGYHTGYVPPGWDRWFATIGDSSYYDYRAVADGTMLRYGEQPSDYGTSVLTSEIVSFIDATDPSVPLFAYFAPSAPHNPATHGPGDGRSFSCPAGALIATMSGTSRTSPHTSDARLPSPRPIVARSTNSAGISTGASRRSTGRSAKSSTS